MTVAGLIVFALAYLATSGVVLLRSQIVSGEITQEFFRIWLVVSFFGLSVFGFMHLPVVSDNQQGDIENLRFQLELLGDQVSANG